uniref:Transforming acidic coiled-coil-containing protein C-terminal domain-containing protein n=1 Tax=Esox lucius TaxID=8010 RepID=A0A3P8XZB1_ESOLU
MSSTAVNDENRGVCPGRKHSNSETSCDIFSLDQPTGRPSILRQSQAENLSNKTTAKGGKVCFQTPRRDPVTKRIVSPTKSVKMACDNESLHISTTEYVLPQEINNLTKSAVSSYPDDEMPIQSKGGYQIDFDNLDSINPFQVSAKMVPSPAGHKIAEVRSKLKSEVSALQAQLRREQLKAQSLENSLDQKVKETEELTNLCDELIAKVQKG